MAKTVITPRKEKCLGLTGRRRYRCKGKVLNLRKWGALMKRLVLLPLVLLVGLLIPSTASASTDREIVPFRTTTSTCSAGEEVRLRGELLLISHFVRDSSGGLHAHFSLVPRHVRGVSTAGTLYKAVGGLRNTFNRSGHGTRTFTFTTQFMLISQGPKDNLLLRETIHVTRRNGRTTADVDHFSVKCVG